MESNHSLGVAPTDLADEDLERELASLHRMRHDTFLHGGWSALDTHTGRTMQLETEYLRRHPERDINALRTRAGARTRTSVPSGRT